MSYNPSRKRKLRGLPFTAVPPGKVVPQRTSVDRVPTFLGGDFRVCDGRSGALRRFDDPVAGGALHAHARRPAERFIAVLLTQSEVISGLR